MYIERVVCQPRLLTVLYRDANTGAGGAERSPVSRRTLDRLATPDSRRGARCVRNHFLFRDFRLFPPTRKLKQISPT